MTTSAEPHLASVYADNRGVTASSQTGGSRDSGSRHQWGMGMFLSDWRVLTRRWYVVVLGLLVTAGLCAAASMVVPAKYEATSAVLLLPPKNDAEELGGNPFLALGGIDTVAGVLARAVSDRATNEEVAQSGGSGDYTVEPDWAAGGPVLLVTVEDRTPEGALATLSIVLTQLPAALAELQTASGVAEASLIQSKEITHDGVANTVWTPLIRGMIAAAAFGLAMTVLAAAIVDSYLARSKSRGMARGDFERGPANEPLDDPAGDDERVTVDFSQSEREARIGPRLLQSTPSTGRTSPEDPRAKNGVDLSQRERETRIGPPLLQSTPSTGRTSPEDPRAKNGVDLSTEMENGIEDELPGKDQAFHQDEFRSHRSLLI
jgi:hypothetical protein